MYQIKLSRTSSPSFPLPHLPSPPSLPSPSPQPHYRWSAVALPAHEAPKLHEFFKDSNFSSSIALVCFNCMFPLG